MSRPRPVTLVPLVCPGCGQDLRALEDDVAFACLPCRRGLELAGQELAPRPLRALPGPAARSGFHLPFWEFASGARVPAFNTREILPLARRFSRRPLDAKPEDRGKLRALVGASMPSPEAWRVAIFAGVADAGSPSGAALLALPFLDEGNRLLDASTGAILYKETIDRCEELIRAART